MNSRTPAFILLFLLALPLPAQQDEEPAQPAEIEPITAPDTTADTLADTLQTTEEPQAPSKSVPAAMLLSTFIPGGGQVYNQSYAKAGLIAGAEATLAFFTVREHLLMKDIEQSWTEVPDSARDAVMNSHRDRRNVFAFFTGAVIAFSVADAYVDAHMFGFRESQTLSLAPSTRGLGLCLNYRF